MQKKAHIITKLMNNPYFSFNIVSDLMTMWQYDFMRHAFEAGTIVAIVAGIIGYFIVLRRSSFAHRFRPMAQVKAVRGALTIARFWYRRYSTAA